LKNFGGCRRVDVRGVIHCQLFIVEIVFLFTLNNFILQNWLKYKNDKKKAAQDSQPENIDMIIKGVYIFSRPM